MRVRMGEGADHDRRRTRAGLAVRSPAHPEATRETEPKDVVADAELMRRALAQGDTARRRTAPNPWVGAVECLEAVLPAVPHALDLLAGGRPH